MNIALDARAVGGRLTGDRTYWRGLIGGLATLDTENRYTLFIRTPLDPIDEFSLLPKNWEIVIVPAPSDRIWSLFSFGAAIRRHNIDIAHVQYTVPPNLGCKVVTTVHDISFRLFPQLFSFKDRTLLNLTIPASIRRADAVITVSESSRSDILSSYPFLKPEKITATHLGSAPIFQPLTEDEKSTARQHLSERYGLASAYILSVGVLQPRKNLPMLIDAFSRARKRSGFPHKLAIAGKTGWLSTETEQAVASAGNDVIMLGYVSDLDLPLLYNCAQAMAYPSLYEGFGLPVLEAMACGCAVITSDNSSLPEVMGQAGILLPANDRQAWEDAVIRVIDDDELRTGLQTLGLKQAARFTWEATARKTLNVYRTIASVESFY
jgi:glycosyltransferase involved in cell wall biosynthesis